jgi:light-harvesting complex I chlorophyll a/b binding protein 1
MKAVAVFTSILATVSAFAPAKIGSSRAVSQLAAEKSKALPFLPYPPNLKGYVGDNGFDPLRISDYVPMDYLRESELKHGRIAMAAVAGFIAVDMGMRVVPTPDGWSDLTAITAHDALVKSGTMGQLLLFFGLTEMIAYISLSQMLQGSGREAGNFGFDPLSLMSKLNVEKQNEMKLKELTNGRAAMLAFAGAITQAVLYQKGFPYF